MRKPFKLHASFDNNMPYALRKDLNDYIKQLQTEGLQLKKMPDVEIYPTDRELIEKGNKRVQQAYREIAKKFRIREGNVENE